VIHILESTHNLYLYLLYNISYYVANNSVIMRLANMFEDRFADMFQKNDCKYRTFIETK